MTQKQRASLITEELLRLYPEARRSLDYRKDYELMVSVRLSAQCTDARVNLVAPILFSEFPTLKELAEAPLERIEQIIYPCGFYKTKAKDIKRACQLLIEKHGGRVPDRMEDLLALPGIGRKSANLLLGDIHGIPGIVADTHCIRISNKLGLCKTTDPYKVELALDRLIEKKYQADFCHALVYHGRAVCTARSPKCGECTLARWCPNSNSSKKKI